MDRRIFVAINYITCRPGYQDHFEELFGTRARQIDTLPGFADMQVLRPPTQGDPCLIKNHWENEVSFRGWTKSDAFLMGHERGADVTRAGSEGKQPPVESDFRTYEIIAR